MNFKKIILFIVILFPLSACVQSTAFMAWLFLNENLTNMDLVGFLITSVGVYIATRD